jgi:hypothetical protein
MTYENEGDIPMFEDKMNHSESASEFPRKELTIPDQKNTTTEIYDPTPVPIALDYSLATGCLLGHGVAPGQPVVICHNYTAAMAHEGVTIPFHVAPTPQLDYPMSYLAVTSAKPHEHVLTLTLQPGMKEYFLEVGVLSPTTVIHEVNPTVSPQGIVGYPFTDALSQAAQAKIPLPSGSHFVSTFPSNLAKEQATALGLVPVQQSSPSSTNNKALMRSASEVFGFEMAPGVELRSVHDIDEAGKFFNGCPKVWMKLAHGAGGDMVIPIAGPLTAEKIQEARDSLYVSVSRAFQQGEFSKDAQERFWSRDNFEPNLSTIILEKDIGTLGEIVGNFSNSMLVKSDGTFDVLAYYSQIIGEKGEFLGSSPAALSQEIQAALLPEMGKVAKFCEELKMFGFMGVDFFLVKDPSGTIKPVFIEMNGRPSSSLNTHLVATKVGAPYWINIDLRSDKEINTYADFAAHFDGTTPFYPRSTLEEGMVIPLSLASMHIKTDGEYTLVRPDKKVRVMIASSQSLEHCLSILASLSERGFTY